MLFPASNKGCGIVANEGATGGFKNGYKNICRTH
jgi:hypothetical protein